MGSVFVVELFVLAQGMPQVTFIPQQAAIQELTAAGVHPSLHDRIHAGHADADDHRVDASLGEDLIDERGELPIPIPDQIARPTVGVLQIHHQVLDGLNDPGRSRTSGSAEHADAPAGVLDDGQDVLALAIESDGLDEVAAKQRVRLGAQEVGPRRGRPLGRRVDAFPLRISHTVEAATLIPRVVSSPSTRQYPQDGFSFTRRRTSARMERTVGGRPSRLGREVRA
jgi:hypothetical protein